MWFEKFGLEHNPFAIRDGTEEFTRGKEFWIRNEMYERVKRFIIAEENVIIKGTRGCGKTTIANMLAFEHDAVFITITPKRDIYECLHFSTPDVSPWVNEVQRCLTLDSDLTKQDEIELYPFKDKIIIIDSPDDLCTKNIKNICDFIDIAIRNDAKNILLFGTEQQIGVLKNHSDVFRKWRTVELQFPDIGFFVELVDKRTGGKKVFTDETIERLVQLSLSNTRKFLELCSDALVEAKINGMETIIEKDFVEEHFGRIPEGIFDSFGGYPRKVTYLNQITDYYRTQADWVKLTDAVSVLLRFIPLKEGTFRKYICQLEDLDVLEKKYVGLRPRVKYNRYKFIS